MEWLFDFIHIGYMLSFMATSYFVVRYVKFPKAVKVRKWVLFPKGWKKAYKVLIVGFLMGLIFLFIKKIDVEIFITTFTIGTSAYELIIKWILNKLKL